MTRRNAILGACAAGLFLICWLHNVISTIANDYEMGPTYFIYPVIYVLLGLSFLGEIRPSERINPVGVIPKNNENIETRSIPSVGKWVGWMLLAAIPLAGLILMIIWANDKKEMSRRNWALASFIIQGVILFVTLFVLSAVDPFFFR